MATARLYCLTNPYMPGLVKVGYTRRSVYARMSELSFGGWGTSATGVPGAFELVRDWSIDRDRAEAIEHRVHQELGEHRVKATRGRRAREFFHLTPEEAVRQIDAILSRMECVVPTPPAPRAPPPVVSHPRAPAYVGPAPQRNPTLGALLLVAAVLLFLITLVP